MQRGGPPVLQISTVTVKDIQVDNDAYLQCMFPTHREQIGCKAATLVVYVMMTAAGKLSRVKSKHSDSLGGFRKQQLTGMRSTSGEERRQKVDS